MAPGGSAAFSRARRLRRRWIVWAAAITVSLCLILLPQWLASSWAFYPLPAAVEQIAQNLFWAFTTSTIFMVFENSINGGGSLLEKYRDIADSVETLETPSFRRDLVGLVTIDQDDDDFLAFSRDQRFLLVGGKGQSDLLDRWGHHVTLGSIRRQLDSHQNHLREWQDRLRDNELVFSPSGIDADFVAAFCRSAESLRREIASFSGEGWRRGPYWVLSEDLGSAAVVRFKEPLSVEEAVRLASEYSDPFGDDQILDISTFTIDGLEGIAGLQVGLAYPQDFADFFYAPEDEGGQAVSRVLPVGYDTPPAVRITDPAYWLAPPRRVLDLPAVADFGERMQDLSDRAEAYNIALRADLGEARRIALGG